MGAALTADLVVVSNRGPGSLARRDDGRFVFGHAAGGLAPSLAHALEGRSALWIAAAMSPAEHEAAVAGIPVTTPGGVEVRLVELSPEVVGAAYRVVANGTLWFLFHGMFDRVYRPLFDRRFFEAWERYRAYNIAFAEAIAAWAGPGATVVVNDYHLALVGAALAERRPDLRTIHFTHTPFCSPDELRVLPRSVATELITGMTAFGSVGFHTSRWATAFRSCAEELTGESPRTVVAPLGVDADALSQLADSAEASHQRDELIGRLDGRQYVFRSDRIEPSKNIVRGFLAFEELLESDVSLRGRVVFGACLDPLREDLTEYLAYRNAIEHTVDRINDRFGDSDHVPIELEIADDHEASLIALSAADVIFVNPIRDGMNLVAKEGPVVSRRDAVLALSTEAGAFVQLGADSLVVEPFDVHGTAGTLHRALGLTPDDRRDRSKRLSALAAFCPPVEWLALVAESARKGPSGRG